MALGYTQPITEMRTMSVPGGKRRQALKADIVQKMRDLRRLITL
jgi:hypothetical protein